MHCYHCSAVADKSAVFCGKCGTTLGFNTKTNMDGEALPLHRAQ